jgi:hypothetical protein
MDKQESRQAEMDTRHQEGIVWRNTVREEDKQWRQETREGDKNWRQVIREEDKEWRQTLREEDKAWRVQSRNEDSEHRSRAERVAKRCCALNAAAQSSKPETSPEKIFALARIFEDWLNAQNS